MGIFDTIGDALGFNGGSAPAPKYGQTRSGGAPDQGNFTLGGDPNFAGNFEDRAVATGQQAIGSQSRIGVDAINAGAAGNANQQGVADMAGQFAGNVAARQTPFTNFNASREQLYSGTGAQQRDVGRRFIDAAEAPQGPSAAQAQLTAGTDDALENALALARSGSGFGESASALSQAGQQSARTIAGAAQESARLRAQEDADFRNRQLAALGGAQGAFGAAREAELATAGQLAGQSEFLTQAELQALAQRDQTTLGAMGLQSGAYAAGTEGALSGYQIGSGAMDAGYGRALQAQGLGLDAQRAALEGSMGFERTNADLYAAELQHQLGMREADQNRQGGVIGGTLSAIGGIAGMFSDRRGKKNIKSTSLREAYAALS